MSVSLDRGVQLEQLRQERTLTDVELVSDNVSLPCHKLILSLHSPYFRTLFQSSGFVESGQDQIVMNHIKGDLLETIIKFIYTGNISISRDSAVDLLEAVTCLQIAEAGLVTEIKKVLATCVRSALCFEELFYIWNISVTYDLDEVLEMVMTEVEVKLDMFLHNTEDCLWLGYLGWEEMRQILVRPQLCIESEAVLLQFVLNWSKDKVITLEDFKNFQDLLQHIRLSSLDKKFVRGQIKSYFPEFSDQLPVSMSRSTECVRSCSNCHYIVQYKLSKTQIRNIEDFIDSGQKSLFLGFNLHDPSRQSSLKCLTNMGSMVGTAAGHYGRPVTGGSVMIQWRHMILVIGGQHETLKAQTRPDILLYNAQKRCWVTSLKQAIRLKSNTVLQDVVQVHNHVYLMIRPSPPSDDSVLPSEGSVERINLDVACQEYRVDKMKVAGMPEELWSRHFTCVRVDQRIYCVSEGCAWVFHTETSVWVRCAPPIGTIGSARPSLAWCPPHVFLVSGRMEDSVNVFQTLDTETGQWRRLSSLETRMTVLDMVSHNIHIYEYSFLIG